jgi:hypothetical protein
VEVVDGGRESKRTHLRAMEVEEDAMAVVVQVVDGGGWSRCPKLAFEGWGGAGGGGEGGGSSRGPSSLLSAREVVVMVVSAVERR